MVIKFCEKHRIIIVWSLRLIIGATFTLSGISKMIDPWGFVYKIEQYLSVWGMSFPRPIIVTGAMGLSASEFILGCMLLIGAYRKTSTWILSVIMLGMLPLSAYIAITNPVYDCGCFGDLWSISNGATFLKNILISCALVYLVFNNRKVYGFINPLFQWLAGLMCFVYIMLIGIIGYNVQPIVDFRSYTIGTDLAAIDTQDHDIQFEFVYEKNGDLQSFTEENLPDSSWTFVERKMQESISDKNLSLTIYDNDEDVTTEVIATEGDQILLLIPELKYADISHSYLINEMYRYVIAMGGEMIGILGTSEEGLAYWKDISMAEYDLYTAEDTALKEFARGNISVIYLKNGIIQWKRSLNSIPSDFFYKNDPGLLSMLHTKNGYDLIIYTLFLIIGLFSIPFIEWLIILKKKKCSKNEKKDVTLQSDNNNQ